MPYAGITEAEIAAGEPISQPLMQKVKENFDDHEARLNAGGGGQSTVGAILNGSLETDSDADDIPDNWTRFFFPGGTGEYDTADYVHGTKSYKFTHPGGTGNGGGYLESDYIFFNHLFAPALTMAYKASAAEMKFDVVARFFDRNRTFLGEKTLLSSTANWTEWTLLLIQNFRIDYAGTEYVKFRIVCGKDDTNVAGSIWVDGIGLEQHPVQHSVLESINQGRVGTYYYYYVDVGTVWTINLPNNSRLSRLVIPVYVEGYSYSDEVGTYHYRGYCRFRIGNVYSSEVVKLGSGYGSGNCVMDIRGMSGAQQVRFQLHGENWYWAYMESPSSLVKYYKANQRTVDVNAGTVTDY